MATDNKDFKVKNGLVVTEGGTFGGTVSVATPTSNTHATTKLYVDDLVSGLTGGGDSSISVSDTPPSSPSEGDLWYNSSEGSTYIYYDSFWVETSSNTGVPPFVISDTEPLNPIDGILWLDTTINRLKYYYGGWSILAIYEDTLQVANHTHDESGFVDSNYFIDAGGPTETSFYTYDAGSTSTTDWDSTYSGGLIA